MTRRAVVLTRLLAVLALLMMRPAFACAHAALMSSVPVDGSILLAAPAEMVLRFDEEVGLISLHVVGPAGVEIAPVRAPDLRGAALRAFYPADLPNGAYLLSYRVASADSHPVAGTIAFAIGEHGVQGQFNTTGSAAAASVWTLSSEVARWVFYVTLMAAAGGALFRVLVTEIPLSLRRALSVAALIGAITGVLLVGLRGALLANSAAPEAFSLTPWRLGVQTTLFVSLAVSIIGLLGCGIGLAGHRWSWRAGGGLAAMVALAGFPLSGHAVTAEPRWLILTGLIIHATAATFWFGSFVPLYRLLANPAGDRAQAVAAVRRFTALAVPAVALLVVSGGILAVVQVAHPAALIHTTYGLLLSSKVAIVAGLVGLAAFNRHWLTPALAAGRADAARCLRSSIGIEIAAGCCILAVTSILTLTPPPRAAVHQHTQPEPDHDLSVTALSGGVMAHINISPARSGRNRITVMLHDSGQAFPPPTELWIELSQEAAGIAPIRRQLLLAGGQYTHEGPELAIPGRWTIRIAVLVTDYDQVTLSAPFTVQ